MIEIVACSVLIASCLFTVSGVLVGWSRDVEVRKVLTLAVETLVFPARLLVQSTNRSVNQSVDQSINPSINLYFSHNFIYINLYSPRRQQTEKTDSDTIRYKKSELMLNRRATASV